MNKRLSAAEYAFGILAGDRVVLSRAITLVESTLVSDRDLADEVLTSILPHTGKSFRLGITGVPGVGKSTFIDAFGCLLTSGGKKVAVLAVDPSSGLTRGSILGDKTRMEKLSRDPQAYIRPSPSAGSLGGVARRTREAMLLCEAAGFDRIIVETVGVGQSETAVAGMVDFFLLLMLSGAGDELQGMKKGIMEMADAVVINKADGTNLDKAKKARAEYAAALHLFPPMPNGWIPRVSVCSAIEKTGLQDIAGMLDEFAAEMNKNGWLDRNRKSQNLQWLRETLHLLLEEKWNKDAVMQQQIKQAEDEVEAGKVAPTVAARKIISGIS